MVLISFLEGVRMDYWIRRVFVEERARELAFLNKYGQFKQTTKNRILIRLIAGGNREGH